MSAGAQGQLEPQELELQVVVSWWLWVLKTKLMGSGGASHVLNHLAVSEGWGVVKKPNKQYRLLLLYLFASQNLRKDPMVEDTTQFGHRTWRN